MESDQILMSLELSILQAIIEIEIVTRTHF